MKIPNRFKMFGTTIIVEFTPEPFTEKSEAVGFASYRLNKIQLRPVELSRPFTQEQIEQTFWHEVMHFIVYHAGEAITGKKDFPHQEEGFIDIAGSLMHQIINSFEYDN